MLVRRAATRPSEKRRWRGVSRRLADRELEDLAGVPPERFGVYTDLVFAGERSMLRWVYPLSLAALVRLVQQGGDTRPAGEIEFELVRELHRRRPWHSTSTRELAENFQRYVTEYRPDLVGRWGGLSDLIDYERTTLDVFYALDFAGGPLTASEAAAWSVGELLAQVVARPPYVQLREYSFDVLSISAVSEVEKPPPDERLPAERCLAVCGRSATSLMPVWLRLSPAEFAVLRGLPAGVPTTLNDVAHAYLAAHDPPHGATEQAAFAEFFGVLAVAVGGGAAAAGDRLNAGLVEAPGTCYTRRVSQSAGRGMLSGPTRVPSAVPVA